MQGDSVQNKIGAIQSSLLFIGLFLGMVVFGFMFGVSQAQAAAVDGYAWSSNTGWIQFDGQTVEVNDGTGVISGQALSVNLGPVVFDTSCGTQAEVPPGGGTVTGWMRVVTGGTAESGNWDGCIKLSGGWSDGVSYDAVTGQLTGYAWGSTVVGWVEFDAEVEMDQEIEIIASEQAVFPGDDITLFWNSPDESDFVSCVASTDPPGGTIWDGALDPGDVPNAVNGYDGFMMTNVEVPGLPGDTVTYTIECVTATGSVAVDEVQVSIRQPIYNVTLAGPACVPSPQTITLGWVTAGTQPFTTCVASGFPPQWSGQVDPVGGTEEIDITADTTFTIACSGTGGSDTDSLTVRVFQDCVYNEGPIIPIIKEI